MSFQRETGESAKQQTHASQDIYNSPTKRAFKKSKEIIYIRKSAN